MAQKNKPATCRTKRTALLIAAALLSTAASAAQPASPLLPTTVGLHLVSHHLGSNGARWNNNNTGVYARWSNGFTVGTLRNSLNRQGTYAAWTWQHTPASAPRVTLGLTAGITSGYDRLVQDDFTGQPGAGQHTDVRCNAEGRCRTVLLKSVLVPLVVPSVALHITPRLSARLSFVPKTGRDAAHALHFSTEWSF